MHRLATIVALVLASAFVFTEVGLITAPADAGRHQKGLYGVVDPSSQNVYYGRYCTPTAVFTISASGGFPPYAFAWDFGDGSPVGGSPPGYNPVTVYHTYPYVKAQYTMTAAISDSMFPSTGLYIEVTAKVSVASLRLRCG